MNKNDLVFDVPYRTGITSTSELHAGGILFYVAFRECLQFSNNGEVKYWCEVVDKGNPLDDEISDIESSSCKSQYSFDDKSNLTFELEETQYIGQNSSEIDGMLIFNTHNNYGFELSKVFCRA